MKLSLIISIGLVLGFTQTTFAHSIKGGTRVINKVVTLRYDNLGWTYLWTQKVETSDGAFLQVAVDVEVNMEECRGNANQWCAVRKGETLYQLRPDATFRLLVNYPHPTRPGAYASVSIDKPVQSLIRVGAPPFKRTWKETLHFQVNIPHVTDGEAIIRILGKQNDNDGPNHRVEVKNLSTFRIP